MEARLDGTVHRRYVRAYSVSCVHNLHIFAYATIIRYRIGRQAEKISRPSVLLLRSARVRARKGIRREEYDR